MKINKSDPRITAYLIGELSASEREWFESQMAADPELRTYVLEMQDTTAAMKGIFANEPVHTLTEEQRVKVLRQTEKAGFRVKKWVFYGSFLTACFAAVFVYRIMDDSQLHQLKEKKTKESALYEAPGAAPQMESAAPQIDARKEKATTLARRAVIDRAKKSGEMDGLSGSGAGFYAKTGDSLTLSEETARDYSIVFFLSHFPSHLNRDSLGHMVQEVQDSIEKCASMHLPKDRTYNEKLTVVWKKSPATKNFNVQIQNYESIPYVFIPCVSDAVNLIAWPLVVGKETIYQATLSIVSK